MLERQGAGRVRHVEVDVLWAHQWVKDRGVSVCAEPTRTNCADLGTKVHSVARFRELLDIIKLVDRDDLEAEASKETLPVAGVTRNPSPLASLITLLFTLMMQGEAKGPDFSGHVLHFLYRLPAGHRCRYHLEEEAEGSVSELVIEGSWWSGTLGTNHLDIVNEENGGKNPSPGDDDHKSSCKLGTL